jgi:ribosomal protein S18 acetylase RimI-like enzyme
MMREYADSLGVDLCFQGFDEELQGLPGEYAPPYGALLIAWVGSRAAGCVALRRWSAREGEMKRLYVRPAFRGLGIGRGLVRRIVALARRRGYRRLRLDTLPSMHAAIALYRELGFLEISAYRANPIPGARFLALPLARSQRPRHRR